WRSTLASAQTLPCPHRSRVASQRSQKSLLRSAVITESPNISPHVPGSGPPPIYARIYGVGNAEEPNGGPVRGHSDNAISRYRPAVLMRLPDGSLGQPISFMLALR